MSYVIAELADGQGGGFAPRGAAAQLWRSKAHELMLSGPAETGKTFTCCQKLDALLWKYPGAQAVVIRKTLSSIYTTVLQTFRNVLGPQTPVTFYGGEKPEWADYPNGARVYFAGMDNPQKALSAERDFIYVCQSEDLDVSDWEVLTTRCTGRAAHAPYAQIFGDCNPGPPSHWILHRPSLQVLYSRHEDNPTLYDEDGRITERGRTTLAILDNLTGVRKKRLRHGLWVQAEGTVYEGWDRQQHLIGPTHPLLARHGGRVPDEWPRFWDVDFGFTNPFVWHEWAQDGDGRLFLCREIYKTQRLVEDHAADIRSLGPIRPREIVCDHDAEDRATLERHLKMPTKAAYKAVSPGIQAVAARLKVAGDGYPRLFVLEDALLEVDTALRDARMPYSTAQEFESYVWDTSPGLRKGDHPVKKFDHGLDGTRYEVAQRDGLAPVESKAALSNPNAGLISWKSAAAARPGPRPAPPLKDRR